VGKLLEEERLSVRTAHVPDCTLDEIRLTVVAKIRFRP